MSIYQKLNDITSRVVTLEGVANSTVTTATTASNFQVTNQLSGDTVLTNTLTASSFSASSGLANLTTLTSSNINVQNITSSANITLSTDTFNLNTNYFQHSELYEQLKTEQSDVTASSGYVVDAKKGLYFLRPTTNATITIANGVGDGHIIRIAKISNGANTLTVSGLISGVPITLSSSKVYTFVYMFSFTYGSGWFVNGS